MMRDGIRLNSSLGFGNSEDGGWMPIVEAAYPKKEGIHFSFLPHTNSVSVWLVKRLEAGRKADAT